MKQKAFTLVEIMVVIAIIAILAAISIPNLMRARLGANESAAQSTLKTISVACESYRASQPIPAYPAADTDLTTATPPYISATVFAGGQQGYSFSYTQISGNEFVACATPLQYSVTGERTFAINETGILRADDFGAPQVINTEPGYDAMTIVD